MFKLLIVDDEEIERKSMQVTLEQAFSNIEIKEARNGRLAVEYAKTFEPDLVLMDIKMPGMDGLEAIKHIKKQPKQPKFIMVTAYDTFAYAKEAIRLGVKDYILKPSKINEIISIVGQVIEQIKQENAMKAKQLKQNHYFEKTKRVIETDIVTQLLFDHVHDVHIDMALEILEIKPTKQVFAFVVLLPEGFESQYPALVNLMRKDGNVLIGALYGRQFPVIVFRDQTQSFRSQATELIRRTFKKNRQTVGQGWIIGIGNPYDSLDQIQSSYHEALIALIDMDRSDHFRFYQDIPIGANGCDQQFEKYRHKYFFDQVRLGEWDKILETCINLIQCYQKESTPLRVTQGRILELIWIIGRILDEMNLKIKWEAIKVHSQDYPAFIEEIRLFFNRLKQKYVDYHQQLEVDSIKQMKKYIIDHSHEDISLEFLSERFDLSTIYISKMFKEKLGMNYIDFLTECRIDKAKALIQTSEKSIKEIALEVGYRDPNYFSKVFKKLTEVSPMTYRKKRRSD
ncbi:response regulator [Amphibacillus xylanus]|uniref:Putative two-component system response regulator n=1 Tax=Amphibacillus xylanus (strain ATCC 51415 / DSM 6626 / JCM 7361 / LMG 17667 / NBRC 15112 / Ep01) TaxID=698758 RepID=K0IVX6_AMPXN|nr:response regulator [Amphibacillus xylanus]BAM46544.1 putative two-component system response regulator [Amphibacillus xylanus NBRC 15112]